MINQQNPPEWVELKEGFDTLESVRVATPAIADFCNDISHMQKFRVAALAAAVSARDLTCATSRGLECITKDVAQASGWI
jgi:hypothetical protein